jgi:hypothetical protein
MILSIYADESTDGRQETVFTVGGFMGLPEMFEGVERKWDAYLKNKGLKYFKATEAENLRYEFEPAKLGMSNAEARLFSHEVRHDLGELIADGQLGGIALTLDIKALRKICSEQADAARYLGSDNLQTYMFKHFIIHCFGLLIRDLPEYSPDVEFIFDLHLGWRASETEYRNLQNHPLLASRLRSTTHADDKKVLALQMADLCAYEGRLHSLFIMGEKKERLQFSQMAEKHSWYSFSMFREEQLLEHLNEARSNEK